MKAKRLSLAIAVLLAAGGLWFARSAWRPNQAALTGGTNEVVSSVATSPARFASHESSTGVGSNMPSDRPKPGQMLNPPARLAPPDPSRRFTDFTPEQRVQFARQGHGPGG